MAGMCLVVQQASWPGARGRIRRCPHRRIREFTDRAALRGGRGWTVTVVFEDRTHAGRELAAELLGLRDAQPLVFGLPRGGVPVAAEVARGLDAPLEVLVVRKLGAPRNRELAVGALAEGGTAIIDRGLAGRLGLTAPRAGADPRARGARAATAGAALSRRLRGRPRWRGARPWSWTTGSRPGSATSPPCGRCAPAGRDGSWSPRRWGRRRPCRCCESEADEVVCHTVPAQACSAWAAGMRTSRP